MPRLDQRLLGHAPAARLRLALPSRRLDARRLAGLLRVVRRPGRIAEARRFLPRRQLQPSALARHLTRITGARQVASKGELLELSARQETAGLGDAPWP